MDQKKNAFGTPVRRRWATALVATGVLAGGVTAGVVGVAAATAAPVLTSATVVASPSASASDDGETNHGGRAGETVVTGAKAATLRAAALKAVPGATVERIETDADGSAYEVHLTKTDGSKATVKFDASLTATGVESGQGKDSPDASDGDGEDPSS